MWAIMQKLRMLLLIHRLRQAPTAIHECVLVLRRELYPTRHLSGNGRHKGGAYWHSPKHRLLKMHIMWAGHHPPGRHRSAELLLQSRATHHSKTRPPQAHPARCLQTGQTACYHLASRTHFSRQIRLGEAH